MNTRNAILACALVMCPVAAMADASLDGTWQTGCTAGTGNAANTGSTEGVTFTDTAETILSTAFSDTSCGTAVYNISEAATYQLGTETSIADAQSIDSTIQSVSITVTDSTYLQAFNSQAVCGITTWQLNTPTDVTGLTCAGTTMPAANSMYYDVVQLNTSTTNGSGVLYFGDSSGANDGSSADKRPTALDTNDVFHKAASIKLGLRN